MSAEPILDIETLADGEATTVDIDGVRYAVVRIGDEVFAIGDRCSHGAASLSEGDVDVDDLTIECPRHGSLFSLETGAALTLPATRPVPRRALQVEGTAVVIDRQSEAATE